MILRVVAVYLLATLTLINCQRSNEAIDSAYLESVLDAAECDRQIEVIQNKLWLAMQFADAGIRIPKGVLQGGFVDLGNYHQCLSIEHSTVNMNIQGKYCSINVPVNQTIEIPSFDTSANRWRFHLNSTGFDESYLSKIEKFNLIHAQVLATVGDPAALQKYNSRTLGDNPLASAMFTFGICVPKVCSTQQVISSLTEFGFEYTENYCRLPDDKPWVGADITAVVIFSILGCVTLLSTGYDLYHRLAIKSDIKAINPVYQAFSVYTNGKRLNTFNSTPGTLHCLDGIRVIAMMWVIVGHTFSTEPLQWNPLDAYTWMVSARALWITVAPMTVDTFFVIGGILVVYTTAGKMTGKKFIQNLHWFYITRMVRIMPLLAVTVLLEASFFNRIGDGPIWPTVANFTNNCRNYWWYTLLHVQNLFARGRMCTGHSWYIAIDVQMYVISPLVLFWVLRGKKRDAWIALLGSLGVVLTAATIYCFLFNFKAGIIVPTRVPDSTDYIMKYYIHPLTRAAPFFVGLIFGYLLHLCRGKKVQMSGVLAIALWIGSFGVLASIFYFTYAIKQMDWDNQFMDNFMNSFMRPAWACAIGWIIFACTHGYSGPINWFLSLDVWRLPARLTYGMYLFHYPFMISINGTLVAPVFFSVGRFTFKFLSYLVLAFVASYILTLLVDSPVSALYKQLLTKALPTKVETVDTNRNLDVNGKGMNGDKTAIVDETKDKAYEVVPSISAK